MNINRNRLKVFKKDSAIIYPELVYPDQVPAPPDNAIIIFRNKSDGFRYYKKSDGNSYRMNDEGNGETFNIYDTGINTILHATNENFIYYRIDNGISIKFLPSPQQVITESTSKKIILNTLIGGGGGGGGGTGAQGSQGATGAQGAQGATGAQGAQGTSGLTQDAVVLHSNQNTNASIGVTNAETTLATFTILANEMGANGYVEIYSYWTVTVSGNAKTVRLKFGGTTYKSFNVGAGAANTAAVSTIVVNRNDVASQVGPNIDTRDQYVPSGTGVITSLVNTAAPVTIEITGQKAVAGETMTLNWAYVLLAHKS